MSLNDEWLNRIDIWRNELPKYFYRQLGRIELSGFITKEQLTVGEALQHSFQAMPAGKKWGAKWEYGWFKGQVSLPGEAGGRRIVMRLNTGGESAVYVNGQNAGAVDREHTEITLSGNGVPGERYQITIESYAGHGPGIKHVGPVSPGKVTVPEPGPVQAEVGESSFGSWEEAIYQLWLDVDTLYKLRQHLDQNSLRVTEIDQGLKDFTRIVDFESPYEQMLDAVGRCRKKLQPLLECTNGSTAPTLFAFGHSHIDMAWLWPLTETERKCTRTLGTQLALLEEYPEYKYLQSQPQLYAMMKAHYPELYTRVKEMVKQGRMIPDGGMWVEADTNLSSGESLIRQFIHGKKFFRDEFGVENELLWLPDVFGYSGALPQIMKGCGIRYFATAKIFWAYGGAEPFPYNTFTWEGIDGSRILVHLCNDYNSHTDTASVIERWNERVQKDGIYSRLFPFGYGDGGGGATRDHLEYLRRMKNLEGVPKVEISEPVEFFKDLETKGIPEITYVGELYFAAHRGTYTSQAKTKKGNRRSEVALREAELWGVAAGVVKKYEYPLGLMDALWKAVLLNQFHDIIPGSSISRVYEEAEASYAKVIKAAGEVTGDALRLLVENRQAVTVFNSLSWERKELIELPADFTGVMDEAGQKLPVQRVDGKMMAEVTVPPCGWTSYLPASEFAVESRVQAGETHLENELLRVEFNKLGEIIRIRDKESGKEFAKGSCNSFKMYKDIPNKYDAWDIDSMYWQLPVELNEPAEINVICAGPLLGKLRITRTLNHSLMTQEVSLRRGSRRVEFKTSIDWQERHKLLKVAFPVNIYATEAVNEIQFGHIKRPTHRSKLGDANKFEVCNHKWTALMEEGHGFAVLNDCKYGIDTFGNSINLTLLKSALAPAMDADQGEQEFTYAFYAWNGTFLDSRVVREAYELNIPLQAVAGYANQASLIAVDAPAIIVETVKPAEDGSGDIIVRMYESKRTSVNCILKTGLPLVAAYQTDMLEQREVDLAVKDFEIELEFRPFEIKTVRLTLSRK